MTPILRIWCLLIIPGSLAIAQISKLATSITGDTVYFETSALTQRGSVQFWTDKLFLLRNSNVTLVEQTPPLGTSCGPIYTTPALSGDGSVVAINRGGTGVCGCPSSGCVFGVTASTSIQNHETTVQFVANTVLSANGRFAALFNGSQAPGSSPPVSGIQLLDLQSGNLTYAGQQAARLGQILAADGTILAQGDKGSLRLVGPTAVSGLHAAGSLNRAELAADASRIVYTYSPGNDIRVLEVATGADRSLAVGYQPSLAQDGRTFSYLTGTGFSASTQVWLGDAVNGTVRALSHEPEGIADQTISGDGRRVIVATNLGRLLSIDTVSGSLTQLLGASGPSFGLAWLPIPGSYNVLFVKNSQPIPSDFVPNLHIGTTSIPILGRVPNGFAVQIPWEVKPDAKVPILLATQEPSWDQIVFNGVFAQYGSILPLGFQGLGSPVYAAIHQDWSGFLTSAKPGLRGETIHMFGVGYGPVSGNPISGVITPSAPLYHLATDCVWKAFNYQTAPFVLDGVFAGLAPGLTGIYQFDFRIPVDWPNSLFNPYCEMPSGAAILTAAVPVEQL